MLQIHSAKSRFLQLPYERNCKMNVAGPACAEVRKAAADFVTFLNKAVTPYHAVEECSRMLREAGFRELKETETWKVEPKQRYFVTKNRSAILAFAVGGSYKSGNGFSIVVGHTDSPCLRVKPVSTLKAEKFLQVGVSTYGGGLWRTWFDRDLSLAGQVVIRQNDSIVRKLINVGKPILFIPNLAIHLETDRTKFECNNETALRPLLASYAAAELNKCDDKKCESDESDPRVITKDHHAILLDLVAKHASCTAEAIIDLDLYLYDTQPAAVTGVKDEFISGARLDNLIGTYTSVCGLIESLGDDAGFGSDPNIRIAACYDNEECGSQSAQGAESAFTEWVLRRLSCATNDATNQAAFEEAIGKSYLISADQAHACHPNYSAKHEENHRPAFHGGVVVKINNNQRYATTSLTHAVLKQIAHTAQVPLQKVVVRNDSPCGSTVGPIMSSGLGLQSIDVGCPSLAMHSIREFGDTTGICHAKKLYSTFFQQLPSVLSSLQ
ncbi:hypothetical protein L596_019117 [Steinernema carpocapsae]|uniref:Aspartyl aminopeptidase n=1 Tax=Steinernema carpocapsae TaxID=34508 RepID=A0A4U5N6P8_STECR|nr:hypothetical protein L596_019117 [Steinernema carpocapsae]